MSIEDRARASYEKMAEAFAARVETKSHNAHYERPATLSLLPPVSGLRVLDAGCGPGVYAAWLVDHGAQVVGIDASPKMVHLAQRRLGSRADIRQADISQPLSGIEAGSFDLVVSALVLDYVRDWDAAFREFRRVLRRPGWLVFSADHPFDQFYEHPNSGDYFAVEAVERTWSWPGQPARVSVPQYRRPLSAMLAPLLDAGFELERVLEPRPQPEFKTLEPEEYARLMRRPLFICFRARTGLPEAVEAAD